jgi:hypothetical protein
MNRAQLVAEIESYGMEVIGNIHDLRDTVKLGRQICLDFPNKDIPKEPETLSKIGLLMKSMKDSETLFIKNDQSTWTIDKGDVYVLTDGVYTHVVTPENIDEYIKGELTISIYDNDTNVSTDV